MATHSQNFGSGLPLTGAQGRRGAERSEALVRRTSRRLRRDGANIPRSELLARTNASRRRGLGGRPAAVRRGDAVRSHVGRGNQTQRISARHARINNAEHAHRCNWCGVNYVHTHQYRYVTHRQRRGQCPNTSCTQYGQDEVTRTMARVTSAQRRLRHQHQTYEQVFVPIELQQDYLDRAATYATVSDNVVTLDDGTCQEVLDFQDDVSVASSEDVMWRTEWGELDDEMLFDGFVSAMNGQSTPSTPRSLSPQLHGLEQQMRQLSLERLIEDQRMREAEDGSPTPAQQWLLDSVAMVGGRTPVLPVVLPATPRQGRTWNDMVVGVRPNHLEDPQAVPQQHRELEMELGLEVVEGDRAQWETDLAMAVSMSPVIVIQSDLSGSRIQETRLLGAGLIPEEPQILYRLFIYEQEEPEVHRIGDEMLARLLSGEVQAISRLILRPDHMTEIAHCSVDQAIQTMLKRQPSLDSRQAYLSYMELDGTTHLMPMANQWLAKQMENPAQLKHLLELGNFGRMWYHLSTAQENRRFFQRDNEARYIRNCLNDGLSPWDVCNNLNATSSNRECERALNILMEQRMLTQSTPMEVQYNHLQELELDWEMQLWVMTHMVREHVTYRWEE